MAVASLCRAGLNLFQVNSQVVGGEYAAPLLLGISKRSILEGQASTPAYAAYTGWHADTMFSLVPSKTQVPPSPPSHLCLPRQERHTPTLASHTQACSTNGLAVHPTDRGEEHHGMDMYPAMAVTQPCRSGSFSKKVLVLGPEAMILYTGWEAQHQPGRHCICDDKRAQPGCSSDPRSQTLSLGHHKHLYPGGGGGCPVQPVFLQMSDA